MSFTRRTVIQGLAALPLAGAPATGDESRIALVIGNAGYGFAPLANPVNDAQDMAELLGRAGFAVEHRVDLGRQQFVNAIATFRQRLQGPKVKEVFFYYAGHGAQLDWRNYLVPVDARVSSAGQLMADCIDLSALVEQLAKTPGRTYVLILDACRDNPFGDDFHVPNKGLSEFDAPGNSLIAYATSPGRAAADGKGRNGLYTGHLLREFAIPHVQIEDALKRVRLNVRLSSAGRQIPWESTSLEERFLIFPDGRPKPTEAELAQQLEVEFEAWARTKASQDAAVWAEFLRQFPSGYFSEIAQARLDRLLRQARDEVLLVAALPVAARASGSAPEPTALLQALPEPVPPNPPRPVLPTELSPAPAPEPPLGLAPPQLPSLPEAPPTFPSLAQETKGLASAGPAAAPLVQLPPLPPVSANPYAAGRHRLGRIYTVGDVYVMRVYDLLTQVGDEAHWRVTRVDEVADRVELNGGTHVWDLMGNVLQSPRAAMSDVPRQFYPAELQLGARWRTCFSVPKRGQGMPVVLDFKVDAHEQVVVPAGAFMAFRLSFQGWDGPPRSERHEGRIWVVPGINVPLRYEHWRRRSGRVTKSDGHELVRLVQQRSDAD